MLFKYRFEGIEGFVDRLEKLASEHLRDCRRPSPDHCVASLLGEVDSIVGHHTVVGSAFNDDPALWTFDALCTVIDYDAVSRDIAVSAEELWGDCRQGVSR